MNYSVKGALVNGATNGTTNGTTKSLYGQV